MKKTLLWLDDSRDPFRDDWLNFSPIGKDIHVLWAKSYSEFIKTIIVDGIPDGICFDHDLGFDEGNLERKTGYDCALWLILYCNKNKIELPLYNIQSSNSIGKERIDFLLKSYNNLFK